MSWIPPVSIPATVVEATVQEQRLENVMTKNDLGVRESLTVRRFNMGMKYWVSSVAHMYKSRLLSAC
jgi:hypothetical protein